MDNLIEYVIILFFIFSLLQPLLSKKKKQQTGGGNQDEKSPDVQQRNSRATQTLEDLFGLSLPKTPDYNTGYGNVPDSEHMTWDPAGEFKNIEGTKPKPLPDIDFDKPQAKSFIDSKRTEMAADFLNQSVETESHADIIRTKLRNPLTIREIILISEILNKPRALRR